jgi:hypothetical protein
MSRWWFAIVLALAGCGNSSGSESHGGTGGMTSGDAGNDNSGAGGAKDGVEAAVDTPATADRFMPPDSADATGDDALADGAPTGTDARPDRIPPPPSSAPPCDPALKVANGAPCQSQGVVFSCLLQPEAGPSLLCICANILQNRWSCGANSDGGVGPATR